jgi:Fic family protein
MMSFRHDLLCKLTIPQGSIWLLESLAGSKGKQAFYMTQAPQLIESLREMALIESAESSNRIEGVTVDRERLRPLVLGESRPRDRSEEEIVGYRMALNWIHTNYKKIQINPETILHLHALAQGGTCGDAGCWKEKQNEIIEILPNGRREVRFLPLAPEFVPSALEELCLAYRSALDQGEVVTLLAISGLVLDFLCIHPFRDGNGRVSRLLTLLALYQQGFDVGRYVSLERLVEQTKESYYETLKMSSTGWHEATHDVRPWFNYFLSTLRMAFREFEDRAASQRGSRGSKTALIAYALENLQGPFGIADVERLCPNVSRDMIRVILNRRRKEGRLEVLGRGRDAKWRPIGRKRGLPH